MRIAHYPGTRPAAPVPRVGSRLLSIFLVLSLAACASGPSPRASHHVPDPDYVAANGVLIRGFLERRRAKAGSQPALGGTGNPIEQGSH